MDITRLIKEHGPALIKQLTGKAGFSPDQATAFLPLLVGKVMELVKGGKFDVASLVGGGDLSGMIGKLGLGAISKQVGVDEAKATAGATVIVPGILESFGKQAGGLAGLAGLVGGSKGGAGNLLKKADGLFG